MKYAVEMGSSAVIYIPNFIQIGSGIQKLIAGGGLIDTQTAWRSPKTKFLFTSATMKSTDFCVVTSCSLETLRRFGGTVRSR
jgi:hypothetical protein